MTARGEDLGLARRIGFGPGDEEAHQDRGVRLARKFGPASASSSRPALSADARGILRAPKPLDLMPLGAFRIEHEPTKAQSPVGDLGETGDRRAAGSIELSEESALAGDGGGGGGIVQRLQ